MSVRRATIEDLAQLVRLGHLEHARSRWAAQKFDAEHVARSFTAFIQGMASAVFISRSGLGFIGGLVQPNLINRHWTAYEVAWYSEDGTGLRLLDALSAWARKANAVELIVHNYSGLNDATQFGRVMQRRGFLPIGGTFAKPLEVA